MMTLSRKSFAIGLLVALLVTYTGRAVPVYALAELAPELAPVFDTQIYQLQDYIEHGGMTDPQLDIFYMLCGFYALGQAGSEDYKLTNPYSTQGGVLNWLKDVGIETYNTLIGLAPDTVVLPNGSIQSTDVLKKAASMYVANLMGCALKAAQYDTVEEFEDDLENSNNFYIPWNKSTQYGLNTMFQTYGGIYEWQFDTKPFTSNQSYTNLPSDFQGNNLVTYNNDYNSMDSIKVRYNDLSDVRNYGSIAANNLIFGIYNNLFVNTTNHTINFVNNSGQSMPIPGQGYNSDYIYGSMLQVHKESNGTYSIYYYNPIGVQIGNYLCKQGIYNPNNYNTLVEVVRDVYNGTLVTSNSSKFTFIEDFIQHVYVGDTWANRHEIFNVTNLNFDDTGTEYYVTPKGDNDYLLDIKGILLDILNNTNLLNVFIDNIYTPDGVLVHDTDLIRINTSIYELLNQQNPPLPVNLNDIADYTDNTYLDRLKEHASNFGDIFADYVAFWHNVEHDLVYTIFGASIMVLIGAFIGKWGHS